MSGGETKQEMLKITVVAQNGANVAFAIKPTTTFSKMFDAYCGRMGVRAENVRFLYDGERLQPTGTPEKTGMKDGDIIDAVLQQTGGSSE